MYIYIYIHTHTYRERVYIHSAFISILISVCGVLLDRLGRSAGHAGHARGPLLASSFSLLRSCSRHLIMEGPRVHSPKPSQTGMYVWLIASSTPGLYWVAPLV